MNEPSKWAIEAGAKIVGWANTKWSGPIIQLAIDSATTDHDAEIERLKADYKSILYQYQKTCAEELELIIDRDQWKANAAALQVEYESRAIWIARMNAILGHDNADGFHSEPDPFEIATAMVELLDRMPHRPRYGHDEFTTSKPEDGCKLDCPACAWSARRRP